MIIGVFSIGSPGYRILESLNFIIKRLRPFAKLHTAVVPHTGFCRISAVYIFEITELHFVSSRHVKVSTVYAVLHLTETVQHVARHIEREHGRQDDIHKVYHPLTRRHARHIISTTGHTLVINEYHFVSN